MEWISKFFGDVDPFTLVSVGSRHVSDFHLENGLTAENPVRRKL